MLRAGLIALFENVLTGATWLGVPLVLLVAGFPLVYVAIGATAQVAIVSLAWRFHFRRLSAARSNLSLATFEAEFSNSGYEHEAIEAAYLDISKDRGLPVQRYDLIEGGPLGFPPEDFEYLARRRLTKIGVLDFDRSPYVEASIGIRSVDDYVRFLSYVMRSERKKAL